MINFIWAEDNEHHIGYQGKLPWYLPNDLKFFKATTLNKVIVMGRNTFESFPGLLPNRINVVVSSQTDLIETDNLKIVHSIAELKTLLGNYTGDIFIIGGATLFSEMYSSVDCLYQTKIDAIFEGDVTMIPIEYHDWKLVKTIPGIVDEKNKYKHEFRIYEKNKH
ncbi:dihydrofolate reductase [Dellaglioa sp. L3N]